MPILRISGPSRTEVRHNEFSPAETASQWPSKIAYRPMPTAADGRNAVLITHGYTSSHQRRRRQPGEWRSAGLVGRDDRPRQGDRYRSLFVRLFRHARLVFRLDHGASINPRTGKAYAPIFRRSRARHRGGREGAAPICLGVRHLVAVRRPVLRRYQPFNGRSIIPIS